MEVEKNSGENAQDELPSLPWEAELGPSFVCVLSAVMNYFKDIYITFRANSHLNNKDIRVLDLKLF